MLRLDGEHNWVHLVLAAVEAWQQRAELNLNVHLREDAGHSEPQPNRPETLRKQDPQSVLNMLIRVFGLQRQSSQNFALHER